MEAFAVLGTSTAIRVVDGDARLAARLDTRVLLSGENGVGKTTLARSIHERSRRAGRPLVTVDSSVISDSRFESALLGPVTGDVNDAQRENRGWLTEAQGGTIFIHSIDRMSPGKQAVLHDYLAGKSGAGSLAVDSQSRIRHARMIAASDRNLLDAVASGTFREDLFYRLNTVHIQIPPLRDRPDDVPVILDYFLRTLSESSRQPRQTVSPAVLRRLAAYSWPGNVRELKQVAERFVNSGGRARIHLEMIPPEILRATVGLHTLSATTVHAKQTARRGSLAATLSS